MITAVFGVDKRWYGYGEPDGGGEVIPSRAAKPFLSNMRQIGLLDKWPLTPEGSKLPIPLHGEHLEMLVSPACGLENEVDEIPENVLEFRAECP